MSRLVLQAVIKSYHAFGPCQERSRQRFLTTDLRSECDEPKRYINLLECLSCHLQRGSGWWLRRPAETWWERSGPNSSVSDNTRAFLSSTLIGISPHPAARLSSAYWQAARRNSDLVRTSVCWTRISARSMSSRISAVIFSVRVWSNFWCCISLPPLQQECNGPADVQNAAVGVGEFRRSGKLELLSMPSSRKLFCRERAPLELKPKPPSSRAPGSLGAVPAESSASCAKLRPLSGRFATRLLSTTWPSSEVSVCNRDAAPVTTTCSLTCPTCSVMLTATRSCTLISTGEETAFLKPACSTVTTQRPTRRGLATYSPDSFVLALKFCP